MKRPNILKPEKHDTITPEIARKAIVSVIKTPTRPDSIALLTAIEDAIDQIASEKMTPIEVLGCLDLAARRFYEYKLRPEE